MLNQKLQFKLSQKLSPQQIQLMKLIQLPLQELEQRLAREIEENPALESGKEHENDLNEESNDLRTIIMMTKLILKIILMMMIHQTIS